MNAVPVERLTRRTESFQCVPYSAVISANTCLARQDAVVDTRHGRKPAQYPRCVGCALGDAVAKRIANPTTPPREEPPEAPAAPEPEAPVKIAKKTKLVRKHRAPVEATCERCNDRPAARVTVRTKPGTETWCTPCRGSAGKAAKTKRHAPTKPAGNSPGMPEGSRRKPAKTPKRKPVSPLADVLARVKRDRVVVDELGGIDAAESFVERVRLAGGPDAVVAFFDEVSA